MQLRERELAESIASSSEEYLRQTGDWSPSDSGDNSTNLSSSRFDNLTFIHKLKEILALSCHSKNI